MDTPMPENTEVSEETEEPQTENTDTSLEGADALGDAGKKALDTMKGKWHSERDKRRALEAELEALRAPKDSPTDQPDADAIRREATQVANARILKSEVKAAAAGKLSDPADALRFLDLSAFEVDDNGEIDADEIAEAITDLLEKRPYLAAATVKRFQGTGDGGAARKASGPSQLTREELRAMSPKEIVKARQEGRLENLLNGK